VQYGTNAMGRNYQDTGYMKLKLFKLAGKQADPGNDHAKEASSEAKPSGGHPAAAGSSSRSRQKSNAHSSAGVASPQVAPASSKDSLQGPEKPSSRKASDTGAPIAAAAGSSAATDGSHGSSSSNTGTAGAAATMAAAAAATAAAAAVPLSGGAAAPCGADSSVPCINLLSARGHRRISRAGGADDTWSELMSWDEETQQPVYSSKWQHVMDGPAGASSHGCLDDTARIASRAVVVAVADGISWQDLLQDLRCGRVDEASLHALQELHRQQ
jgi:hypothetical protein